MALAQRARAVLQDQRYYLVMAAAVLALETAVTYAIIQRVPYTEIDWRAYMQEVAGVMAGERDYRQLGGDTGPLVYPAGFVWVFAGLRAATGGSVRPAQYVFMAVYLATLALALAIHRAARVPWPLVAGLALSRRLHSIYVLRLFNDGIAMLPAYAAIATLQHRRTRAWSGLLLSAGIAVKMNVQLMLPGAAYLWWRAGGIRLAATQLGAIALSQVVVAIPFLRTYPASYVARAFDYARRFDFTWTVNWRFVGPTIFASRTWALTLLGTHVVLLAVLALAVWPRLVGLTPCAVISQGLRRGSAPPLNPREVAIVIFSANFAGIVCARSLHYQFYAWYAHSLPLLLHASCLPLPAQLVAWLTIEAAWNIFPSTNLSSLALLLAHCVVLGSVIYHGLCHRQQKHSKVE